MPLSKAPHWPIYLTAPTRSSPCPTPLSAPAPSQPCPPLSPRPPISPCSCHWTDDLRGPSRTGWQACAPNLRFSSTSVSALAGWRAAGGGASPLFALPNPSLGHQVGNCLRIASIAVKLPMCFVINSFGKFLVPVGTQSLSANEESPACCHLLTNVSCTLILCGCFSLCFQWRSGSDNCNCNPFLLEPFLWTLNSKERSPCAVGLLGVVVFIPKHHSNVIILSVS